MKKTIYLILSVILGIMISFIIHGLMEIVYLNWVEKSGHLVAWNSVLGKGSCALSDWVKYGLLILGIIGGYLLGRHWWQIVYMEKRHWRFKNKNNENFES